MKRPLAQALEPLAKESNQFAVGRAMSSANFVLEHFVHPSHHPASSCILPKGGASQQVPVCTRVARTDGILYCITMQVQYYSSASLTQASRKHKEQWKTQKGIL